MRLRKFLLGAAKLACSGTTYAQTKPDDVKTFTLKNGMKFLVLEDHSFQRPTCTCSGK